MDCSNSRRRLRARAAMGCTPRWRVLSHARSRRHTALISHAVDPGRVRTLAVFSDGAPQPNYEYALAGTPCAAVLRGEVVHHETGTGKIPHTSRDYRGYYGVPITSGDGAVLGHLCAFGQDALPLTHTSE